MKSFDLDKFRSEFLKSDGWQVSDCYKPYDDKFLRRDAQDAYEGAKWGFKAGQQSKQDEVDELQKMIDEALECVDRCTWNVALIDLKKILKGDQS